MTPSASINTKRSVGFLFGMCILMLGANMIWVSYNTVLLPTLIEKVYVESKGLIVGLIGFFGTLLALIASLLWGIISDHTSSRWGKRTPAILMGALVTLPLTILPSLFLSPGLRTIFFPVALPIIIISYFGMQFFSNVSNGAWWPLLVDVVHENQRGLASGIQGLMTLVGSALSIVLVTMLNQRGYTEAALWLISGLFACTGIINAWVIKGKDKPADSAQRISIWRAMGDIFKVRTRVVVFFWLVLALFLANMGFNSLQFFARYFFEVYFPTISPDAGFRIMGSVSLVMMIVSALGSGYLSDKIGRRSLILWAMYVCAVTTLLMGLTGNFSVFLMLTALRSIATGPILATAVALASDLSPKDEAGQYMAYNNLSTGLSGALSSLIFGFLLASLTKTTFMILFVVSALLFLAGGILFSIKVPQRDLDAHMNIELDQAGDVT